MKLKFDDIKVGGYYIDGMEEILKSIIVKDESCPFMRIIAENIFGDRFKYDIDRGRIQIEYFGQLNKPSLRQYLLYKKANKNQIKSYNIQRKLWILEKIK